MTTCFATATSEDSRKSIQQLSFLHLTGWAQIAAKQIVRLIAGRGVFLCTLLEKITAVDATVVAKSRTEYLQWLRQGKNARNVRCGVCYTKRFVQLVPQHLLHKLDEINVAYCSAVLSYDEFIADHDYTLCFDTSSRTANRRSWNLTIPFNRSLSVCIPLRNWMYWPEKIITNFINITSEIKFAFELSAVESDFFTILDYYSRVTLVLELLNTFTHRYRRDFGSASLSLVQFHPPARLKKKIDRETFVRSCMI